MGAMFHRPAVALAFVLAACGATDAVGPEPTPPATPAPTVPGVGQLPDTIPTPPGIIEIGDEGEPIPSVVVTRPVDDDGVVLETVAERVNGNRLLTIGDSILASTATRYGDELCDALTPMGWTVEVDAEPGRFIEFGSVVLEERLPDDVEEADDWDAAIVHLGSNYGGDAENYFLELNEILFWLSPRPTLVLTVTEFRPEWAEVNDTIDQLAGLYDNVTVIDWKDLAATPSVLSRDGLHPNERGQRVLVRQLGLALGSVSQDEGECLRSAFADDSAVDQAAGPADDIDGD